MTPEQFCYWLQGRAELQPDVPLSDAEWKSVREHLATVFVKVTPPVRETVTSTYKTLEDAIKSAPKSPTVGWPFAPGMEPRITC